MNNTSEQIIKSAILSDASYNKPYSEPAGWTVFYEGRTNEANNGFDAVAYKNNISGEIVVVFRGTELSVTGSDGDLAADFDLVNNSQFSKAKDFYREVANKAKGEQKSISYIAGHSLGGTLATYVGIDNNVQTYAWRLQELSATRSLN